MSKNITKQSNQSVTNNAPEHRYSFSKSRNKFGSWNDWDCENILYLLHELRAGHGYDGGKRAPAFICGVFGLAMAIAETENKDNISAQLTEVLECIWQIASHYLGYSDQLDDRTKKALSTIERVTSEHMRD